MAAPRPCLCAPPGPGRHLEEPGPGPGSTPVTLQGPFLEPCCLRGFGHEPASPRHHPPPWTHSSYLPTTPGPEGSPRDQVGEGEHLGGPAARRPPASWCPVHPGPAGPGAHRVRGSPYIGRVGCGEVPRCTAAGWPGQCRHDPDLPPPAASTKIPAIRENCFPGTFCAQEVTALPVPGAPRRGGINRAASRLRARLGASRPGWEAMLSAAGC